MSVVSNVILHYGHFSLRSLVATTGRKSVPQSLEHSLREVNRYFGDGEGYGFVSIDDASLPRGWYGGTKMFEASVAYGAFNYLTLDTLMDHLQGLPWRDPERVQLIIREQRDDRFRILNVQEWRAP